MAWRRLIRLPALLAVLCAYAASAHAADRETLSLAGTWRFDLDPTNIGITQRWFAKALGDSVALPGSTDTNRKGVLNTRPADLQHPSRVYEYAGAAWYQRDITIPETWKSRWIELFLERCHWETQVWIDDKPCGMQDSLCVPHVYDLGKLSPGAHRLTIRVDNSIKYDVGGWAHSITEETQTNWNGIVGRIELRATPSAYVESVQIYPDLASGSIKVRTSANGPTKFEVFHEGELVASRIADGSEATIPIPDPKPWDEFSPSLYTLVVSASHTSRFAFRDLRVQDKRITLNGRKVFLRGTLECCIFPRTGFPPTDLDSWMRILGVCKSYGLNHVRFHSWCPPEAAFEAADRMGFLFQVELPQWVGNVGRDAPRDEFIRREMLRILDTYGNHPSFGMLCMGNELSGDPSFLQKLVAEGKRRDPRRLYTSSTAWSFGPNDDYNVAAIRGLHGPTTDADFSAKDAESKVPIISHEIGQWSVFPSIAEVSKYTGVTSASNFELIRDGLRERGILDQAADFTRASGKLSAQLYKEEIEVLLRTPGHGGFQLLDLHDFPGQGTALVGILDAFWESKGIITPEDWRRFCGPIVPLLRMSKRTWTADETFTAKAQVAHFGPSDIDAAPVWSIRDESGREVASGTLPTKRLPTGDLHDLGSIAASLAGVDVPCRLTVAVSLEGADVSNSWSIWVYPSKADVAPPADVLVTGSIGEAKAGLDAGKKVLMLASRNTLLKPGQGSPTTVFWSPILFTRQKNFGMGILCDPKHPALAEFPTESHADWQWWELLEGSYNMALDGTPRDFRPIVQVIDNFIGNRKLGNLLEARVGNGRLMVCSMNIAGIDDARPAARQMLRSILGYMASDAFRPKQALTFAELDTFLAERKPGAMESLGARITAHSEHPGYGAALAIDGDPDTFWHTSYENGEVPYPHRLTIDLGKSVALSGFKYLPRQDMRNGWFTDYEFYVSEDGDDWGSPVSRGSFAIDDMEKVVRFDKPVRGRFVRLVAVEGVNGNPWAAVAELDVLLAN